MQDLKSKNKQIAFTGIRESIYKKLEKDGFIQMFDKNAFYPSLDKLLLQHDKTKVYLEKE